MPFVKESIKEIKYALDVLKLDGVGLLSNYNESFLGDDCFDDVMRVINDRKGIVFVHPRQFKSHMYLPIFLRNLHLIPLERLRI